MVSTLSYILIATLINGLIAFAGATLFFINEKKLEKFLILFLAFETGALLGGAFFHFIPESLEKISLAKTTILTILGFALFLSLEKILHWHHCHNEKRHEHTHTFTYLLLWGDAIHNFIDGLLIASSFIISIPVGIITSSLIIAHELPQELSDFAVLIYGGFTKKKALIYNFISQLTAVLGGVLGYFFLSIKDLAIFLIPISAGGFIYIAVADLIPELHKNKEGQASIWQILTIILGVLAMFALTFLE